jgi:hypothetical protein
VIEASYVTDQAQLTPQRVVIGIDLSKSNPLINEPEFASRVGARVANIVRGLGFASEVHVRTFGSYDATSNNFHYDTVISVRNRPDDVAAQVEKLIAGTPALIERGKWVAQNRTNILAFLDNVSQSIGCSGMPTTVILATDGIEDSVYARLDDPDDHLPAPEGKPFAGCTELQILGVGEGTKPDQDDAPARRMDPLGPRGRVRKIPGFERLVSRPETCSIDESRANRIGRCPLRPQLTQCRGLVALGKFPTLRVQDQSMMRVMRCRKIEHRL